MASNFLQERNNYTNIFSEKDTKAYFSFLYFTCFVKIISTQDIMRVPELFNCSKEHSSNRIVTEPAHYGW